MKSNELMICDWVNWHTYTDVPNYCRITKVEYGKILDCKPIPLTPEILLKNGFVQKSKYHYKDAYYHFWRDEDGRTEIYIYHLGDELVSSIDIHKNLYTDDEMCYTMPYPYYVHELQHTLRLCGLGEMADNFKV